MVAMTDAERKISRAKSRAKWAAKNPGYHAEYAKSHRDEINRNSAKYLKSNPSYVTDWAQKNAEQLSRRKAAAYEANKPVVLAACREYRLANLDKKRARDKLYQAKNMHKFLAIGAKRRAAKRQAVPAWANLDDIKDVYLEAQYMQMHVDHIVPLTSKTVCGLHVWDNLQLLPARENIAKGNRFWPDMPSQISTP